MDTLEESKRKHVSDLGFDPDSKAQSGSEGRLYVGGWLATRPEIIRALNIKCVFSIGAQPIEEIQNVQYAHIILDDNVQSASKLYSVIPTVTGFIRRHHQEHNYNVLVHCSSGKSRSVAIVTVYLMRDRGMSLEDARDYIQAARPIAKVNEGFQDALEYYQETLCEKKTKNANKMR